MLVRNLRATDGRWRGTAGPPGRPTKAALGAREQGLARGANPLSPTGLARGLKAHAACCNWPGACATSTVDGRMATRKTMILALVRKLLIALWRLATTGEVPEGVVLRPAT